VPELPIAQGEFDPIVVNCMGRLNFATPSSVLLIDLGLTAAPMCRAAFDPQPSIPGRVKDVMKVVLRKSLFLGGDTKGNCVEGDRRGFSTGCWQSHHRGKRRVVNPIAPIAAHPLEEPVHASQFVVLPNCHEVDVREKRRAGMHLYDKAV
jgi:hypothetical protein